MKREGIEQERKGSLPFFAMTRTSMPAAALSGTCCPDCGGDPRPQAMASPSGSAPYAALADQLPPHMPLRSLLTSIGKDRAASCPFSGQRFYDAFRSLLALSNWAFNCLRGLCQSQLIAPALFQPKNIRLGERPWNIQPGVAEKRYSTSENAPSAKPYVMRRPHDPASTPCSALAGT